MGMPPIRLRLWVMLASLGGVAACAGAPPPGPETRKPLPGKLQLVETGAATAAAILGTLFSSNLNTFMGISTPIGMPQQDRHESADADEGADGANGETEQAPPEYDAGELTPWVRFGPPSPDKKAE
jgi:hypothetical protein